MTLEAIDLNLVLVLHHVLETRSVVRAAERLHVTSSAVSNSLARLREHLHDPLLVRRGRSLVPTPLAAELAPRVSAAVAALRETFEGTGDFDPARCERTFTLASADNIVAGLLPQIVARFRTVFPRARLDVVTLDHAITSDGLAAGPVDVLLGLPPEAPEVRTEPAYTDHLVCGTWKESRARPSHLERFLELEHIQVSLQGKVAIDYIDSVLAPRGLRRKIALSVPQFAAAAMFLEGTQYVAMLPEGMARRLARWLPISLHRPPVELPEIVIQQAWHLRTDADPACARLRQIISECGRSRPVPRSRRP